MKKIGIKVSSVRMLKSGTLVVTTKPRNASHAAAMRKSTKTKVVRGKRPK